MAEAGDDIADTSDPRPLPPEQPDPSDCCGEGCVRCVYDVHDEAVQRYRVALQTWLARHP